jgi:hypothetical protein
MNAPSSPSPFILDTLLVPQGSEYQAVVRGLKKGGSPSSLVAIPAGGTAVKQALLTGTLSPLMRAICPQGVIVMGLAGSLSPHLKLGQIVLFRSCLHLSLDKNPDLFYCDAQATQNLIEKLGDKVQLVDGLSSDRVITQANEKQILGEKYQVQVVEMEGAAILRFFSARNIPVVILRVIGDDMNQSLPDLSQVYSEAGALQTWPLAKALISQPITGLKLIRSSLHALHHLEALAAKLF